MQINNLTNELELVWSATEKETIPKLGLRTRIYGDLLILILPAGDSAQGSSQRGEIKINWNDVTLPAGLTSTEDLRTILLGYIGSVYSGASGIPSNCYIGKLAAANGDFNVSYTGPTTITINTFPAGITTIIASDIFLIRQIDSTGVWVADYMLTTATITMVGAVITVAEATFAAGDAFIVFTSIPRVSSGGGGSLSATHWSPVHFQAAYASGTTITITGISFVPGSEQIVYIRRIPLVGDAEVLSNGSAGVTMTIAGGVISVVGAPNAFMVGDKYEVGINGTPIGNDIVSDVIKMVMENASYAHFTDPEHIDEDNKGAQNDIKYTRHAYPMGSFVHKSFTYLITADDAHNIVRLMVYATNKHDYVLPNEDTAIADADMIYNISDEVLGDPAGITVTNGSAGDNVVIDTDTKFHTFIFELQYSEDNTGTPLNAADVYPIDYYA